MRSGAGIVYVLTSQRYPDVSKVGWSRRGADVRIAELSRAPGYRGFGPWRLVASCRSAEAQAVEREVKRRLARRRVHLRAGCQELFRVPAEEASRLVYAVAAEARPAAAWPALPSPLPLLRRLARWLVPAGACAAVLLAATARGQTYYLEDSRGRPTGRIEQVEPDRWRLEDRRGIPQGSIEQRGDGSLRLRDWRGRPVDDLPPLTGGPAAPAPHGAPRRHP